MGSLTGPVASCFTAFGKALGICQSEAMVFTSVVICLLLFFCSCAKHEREGPAV